MSNFKCKECGNELVEIYKKGKVEWCEYYVDEDGELRDYESGGQYYGQENATLFCRECKQLADYYCGRAHDDTDEYMSIQEQGEIDSDNFKIMIDTLSRIIVENPECVNFSNLKEFCELVKVDISNVMKSIAHSIVEQQRPYIYPCTSSKDEIDDEIPF